MPGDQPRMTFNNERPVIGVQGENRGHVEVSGASLPLSAEQPRSLAHLLEEVREELCTARDRAELGPDSYADAQGLAERATDAAVRAESAESAGSDVADAEGARMTVLRSLLQLRGLAEGVTGVLAAVGAALAAVQGIG